MDEAGLKGFEVSIWHALYAPKGTPKAVIDKLTKALQEALTDNNVKQRFAELGTEPVEQSVLRPKRCANISRLKSTGGVRSSRRPGSMPTERVILKVTAEKAGDRPGLFFGFFYQRLVVQGA